MIPEFTDEATFADILGPAMDIAQRDDREEAARYLGKYVAYLRSKGHSKEAALSTAKSNLGYYAGYYGTETMRAVSEVFGALHPVFGHRDDFGRMPPTPSPDELIEMGRKMAEGEDDES